jgi:hypothetical protein
VKTVPQVLDADGRVVPDGAADAFADVRVREFAGAVKRLGEEARRLAGLADEFAGSLTDVFPWVRWVDVAASLRLAADEGGEAAGMVARGLPYRLCRRCGGRGCPECKASGHLPRG